MDATPATLVFAEPRWFWAMLVLAPLLALRAVSFFSRRSRLPGLVSPRLHGRLVTGGGEGRKWTAFLLRSGALALIVVALARPQFGYDEVETETESRNLLLAIDTSRSMLAGDLSPDRLSRAKLAATDIVRSLPDDRVGLIAFAGRPFLQAPLTADHEAIFESIDQLDTEIIPRGGTNLAAAVGLALDTFAESEVESGALVIFSDGEALEGTAEFETRKTEASRAGISLFGVGVGTAAGAIIPELDDNGRPIPGEFVRDEAGQVVRTRLDPSQLRALVSSPRFYHHLGGATSLSGVVDAIERGIAASRESADSTLRPRERFVWPLSGALLLFVLAHALPAFSRSRSFAVPRPAATVAGTALVFLFAPVVRADDPLFAGHEQFAGGKYEEAIRTYEGALSDGASRRDRSRLHMGIGASAYRIGDLERATEAYGAALADSDLRSRGIAHYNLGNTLFRKGETALSAIGSANNPDGVQSMAAPSDVVESTIATWENAVEHYESALEIDPANEKARHNLEVVRKRIEELKKEQEEQEQQQEEEKKKDEEEKEDEKEEEQEKEKEQEQEQEQEQESEGDDEGSESPEEQGGEQPENQDPSDQDNPPGKQPESPGDQKNEDPEDQPPGEEPRDDGKGDPQQSPPQPEGPSEAPPEGDLSSDPQQSQSPPPTSSANTQPMAPVDPETGYAPSEARQLLEALADETEVRPILRPSPAERYKNW